MIAGLLLIAALVVGAAAVPAARAQAPESATLEEACRARGWRSLDVTAEGYTRQILWKAPAGAWTRGAIVVLHGGGGRHAQWCAGPLPVVAPQARFAERAVEAGAAVFLPDSSDRVTDNEGRLCGKVWDDEVRARPNLDLPFLREILATIVPSLRPAGSRTDRFLTGLSSGGYMTVRTATRFDHLVTAIAPVSGGDPYGWHRRCERGLTPRQNVHGVGLDNETGRPISQSGACAATRYANEKTWETSRPARKPAFRFFHHRYDGLHDFSCGEKARAQLLAHGYPEVPPYFPDGDRRRRLRYHFWQDEYSPLVLDFFASQIGR